MHPDEPKVKRPSPTVTIPDAAKQLGVTPQALYIAIREGRLKATKKKVCRDVVAVKRVELERFQKERAV